MALYAIGLGLSQRKAAWLCSTARSGLLYRSKMDRRDRHLANALLLVSRRNPAWGYRLSCGYLRLRGWRVNPERVYRVWQRIGLSLPAYRPRRKINTGAKLAGLALRRNDVWAWDFVHDRHHDTQTLRCLTVKDEATGYCLAIKVDRNLRHDDVRAVLQELVCRDGKPRAIRCDNGREFLAEALQLDLERRGRISSRVSLGRMAVTRASTGRSGRSA